MRASARGTTRRGPAPTLVRLVVLPVLGLLAVCGCERIGGGSVYTRAGTAMGTVVEMKVVATTEDAAERELDAAFQELRRVEQMATPYDPGSELSRINARTDSLFTLSGELDTMFAQAMNVSGRSGGAFDPTIGALVAAWGFPDHPALPDSAAVPHALHRAHNPRSWIDADPKSVLDLGGIAKGWGVDRAADVLGRRSGACLVNAGGDLVVRGTKPGGAPWLVGVQHPRDPTALYCRMNVPPGFAVATSGDYEREFEVDGVRYHHLLDPKTGYPARGLVSATVVAPTCAEADAWATAAFVLGPVEGLGALEREKDLEGLLLELAPDGAIVEHETTGFAALRLP